MTGIIMTAGREEEEDTSLLGKESSCPDAAASSLVCSCLKFVFLEERNRVEKRKSTRSVGMFFSSFCLPF